MKKILVILTVLFILLGCAAIELPSINTSYSDMDGEYQLEEYESIAVLTAKQENGVIKSETMYLYLTNYSLFKFLAYYNKTRLINNENLREALQDAFSMQSTAMSDFMELVKGKMKSGQYDELVEYGNKDKMMLIIIEINQSGETSFFFEEWDGETYTMRNHSENDIEYISEMEYIEI